MARSCLRDEAINCRLPHRFLICGPLRPGTNSEAERRSRLLSESSTRASARPSPPPSPAGMPGRRDPGCEGRTPERRAVGRQQKKVQKHLSSVPQDWGKQGVQCAFQERLTEKRFALGRRDMLLLDLTCPGDTMTDQHER